MHRAMRTTAYRRLAVASAGLAAGASLFAPGAPCGMRASTTAAAAAAAPLTQSQLKQMAGYKAVDDYVK